MLCLTGCAGVLSMPGGSEDVNPSSYKTPDDLLERLHNLTPGTPQQTVMTQLGRTERDMERLQRNEILIAMYGSNSVEFRDGQIGQDAQSRFLQSLYGYRLKFKDVNRELGFTSPFRIRTDETGYDYTVTLIFQDGKLFQSPIVTGGAVNTSSSKTIFDYLSPGSLLGYAMK